MTGFHDPEPQDLVFSLQTYYIVRAHRSHRRGKEIDDRQWRIFHRFLSQTQRSDLPSGESRLLSLRNVGSSPTVTTEIPKPTASNKREKLTGCMRFAIDLIQVVCFFAIHQTSD